MRSGSSARSSRPRVAARAALIDLFDTLVWSEWTSLRERMEARLGLPHLRLLDGFLKTQEGRGTGAYGSADGDMVAVLESIGVEPTQIGRAHV